MLMVVKARASAFGGGCRIIFLPSRSPIPLPQTVVHRLMNIFEVAGMMISRAKSLGFFNYKNPLKVASFETAKQGRKCSSEA